MAKVIVMIEHAMDMQGFPGSEIRGFTDMIAGDFLNIYPSELKFPFHELNTTSSCYLQLTNKTEHFIAFKVLTTNRAESIVNPNNGIILPRSVCNVTVTIRQQNGAPPNMQCNYKFMVQSVMAPNGATRKDITASMFHKEENKVVQEFKLRAVYTHVLEKS
ncbi:hypothetical protein L2E82_30256 [Cichorium intybus]|uniref:Uncharacterized protein n=2 Tax=Cichorium intybus TaxID=13427 RepID=A0ACB9CY24_CICIN|nr:hypothetical protein L2E82_29530 [Cichorium intybus]KAI3739844.1 hypothetical protein L2E82_30256 [Cichorium intybus]